MNLGVEPGTPYEINVAIDAVRPTDLGSAGRQRARSTTPQSTAGRRRAAGTTRSRRAGRHGLVVSDYQTRASAATHHLRPDRVQLTSWRVGVQDVAAERSAVFGWYPEGGQLLVSVEATTAGTFDLRAEARSPRPIWAGLTNPEALNQTVTDLAPVHYYTMEARRRVSRGVDTDAAGSQRRFDPIVDAARHDLDD